MSLSKPRRLTRAFRAALALAALAAGSAGAHEIQHVPVPNAVQGRGVPIDAVVLGTEPVSVVYLFFRQPGGAYRPLQMTGSGSQFSAEIPDSELTMQGVDYYLEATSVSGIKATFPPLNAAANPLRISVLPVLRGFEIVPVYPAPEEVVDDARPDIVVHFTAGQGGLDRKSVRVLVDGAILTKQALITEEYLKVRPAKNLEWGPHTIFVNAKSREGVWRLLELTFYVRAPVKRPVAFRGSVSLEATQVDVVRAPADLAALAIPRPPGGRGLSTRLESSGRIGEESVRLSVRTTPIDRGEQPSPDFYSMELRGARHRLTAGDTTARLTGFSAPYLRLRGGEATADLGPVTLHGLGGIARRAISTPQFNTGTYRRDVYGGRASLRLGGAELGAQALYGADDLNSLPPGVAARALEGWMGGMNAAIPLPRDLKLTAEGAGSRLIADRTQPVTLKGEAWDARLEQRVDPLSWSLAFRQVSPDYFSPGGPAVQNDYRAYEAGAGLVLSSWTLRGSAVFSEDNLRGQKPSTLRTRILGMGAGLPADGRRPRLDFSFSDTRQKSYPSALFPVDSETFGVNLAANQSWKNASANMSLGYTRFMDYSSQPLASDSEGYSGSLSGYGRLLQFQWGLSGGGNMNRLIQADAQTAFVFGTASLGRRLPWGLNAQLRGNVNRGTNNTHTLDTLQLGYEAGLGWTRRRLRLDLTVRGVRFDDRILRERSYIERAYSLATTYSF